MKRKHGQIQKYPKDPQNMKLDKQGMLQYSKNKQQGPKSKKIRLQPYFSIIPDTCLGGQVHKGKEHKGGRVEDLEEELTPEYYKFKSDHALIRVEFEYFVIYSWNLLNGDDVTVIPYTFGPFNYLKSKEFPKGFGYPIYNDKTNKFAEEFKQNNAERTQNLLDIVDREKQDEGKPVILFFQEVGPTMLDVIQKHYQDNYHIFHDNDEAEVAWDPVSKRAVVKMNVV